MVVHLERIVAWKIRHHELRAHLEFGSRGYVQRARLEVSRVQVETKASIAVSRRLATSVVDGARALRARLVDEIPELLLEERAVRENFDHRRGTRVGRDALVAFVTRQRQREARVRFALAETKKSAPNGVREGSEASRFEAAASCRLFFTRAGLNASGGGGDALCSSRSSRSSISKPALSSMSSNAAVMLVKPSRRRRRNRTVERRRRRVVGFAVGVAERNARRVLDVGRRSFSSSSRPRVGRFVAPHLRASSPVSALSPELRARRERAD